MRTIFIFLFCASIALGQSGLRNPSFVGNLKPDSGVTFLLNQGFEGTGTDNGETWVLTSGAPLEDPDNTEFAITGSQNIVLRRSGGTTADAWSYFAAYGGTTNQSIVFGYGVIQTTTTNAAHVLFYCRTNTTTKNFVRVNSNARIQVFSSNGAVSASPADAIGTNTTVHIYWGINNTAGTGFVEWNTTKSFSGSGSKYAAFTGGETGMFINNLSLRAAVATTTNWMDNIKVSPASFTP